MRPARAFGGHDLELLAVVSFWGLNLTIAKFGLAEMAPLAFNYVRVAAAGLILLGILLARGESLRTGLGDGVKIALLGFVGHAAYQVFFIEGLARTTATHSALIFALTPVLVGVVGQAVGIQRVGAIMWAAAALAFGGVYVIIAAMPPAGGPSPSLSGDLLILAATACWAIYTTLSLPLLKRHSALKITGLTMAWGVVFLSPLSAGPVLAENWSTVSRIGWGAMAYGILFPLVLAYLLWYRSIRLVGSFRTALYSNLVPVSGALSGWLMLGERLYPAVGAGAAAIFAGILLSRRGAPGEMPEEGAQQQGPSGAV